MNDIKSDEKRNQIWKILMIVSTVVIIIIAAFFIIKLFTANPLEGRWSNEDKGIVMTIKGDGTAVLKWPDESEAEGVSVVTEYSIDKDTKTFAINISQDAIHKAADSSKSSVTEETLESLAGEMEGTYDYSIENKQLILTDREYGEKMVFVKK